MIPIDPALRLALRVALALLFASAARHKLREPATFAAVVAAYRLLPGRAVAVIATLLPAAETVVAVALLYGPSAFGAAVAAAMLLSLYSVAIAWNLARGRVDIDCGCGVPGSQQRLSVRLLVRNAGLIGCAVAAAMPASGRALEWTDAVTVAGAVSAAALLSSAAARMATWRTPEMRTGGPS